MRDNKHKGELSVKATRRIKHAVEWLLIRSKPQPVFNRQQNKVFFFRLNFITLTLPVKQFHSDQELTGRCLNNFLNMLRSVGGVESYIWKAEAQANGNIHYHITTNKFIHWSDVRKWWCQSLELLGYITKFRNKWHHSNPPCSEIKKVKHIRRLAAYLSKYLAKNKSFSPIGELREINGKRIQVLYTDKAYRDEVAYKKVGKVVGTVLVKEGEAVQPVRKIQSNLWGCSRDISACKSLKFDQNSPQWDGLKLLIKSGSFHRVNSDYVDSYFGDVFSLARKHSPALYEDMLTTAFLGKVNQSFSDDVVFRYLDTILLLEQSEPNN